MRAQQRDANEGAIVAALEAIGASVDRLPGGNGRPDLLVGYRRENYALEIKDPNGPPSRRKLNNWQRRWHAAWRGRVHIVETPAQAFEVIGAKVHLNRES
jgi:hypothetical protein